MHASTGKSSSMWSNALEDLSNRNSAFNSPISRSYNALKWFTRIFRLIIQKIDIYTITIMLGDNWGNSSECL